MIMKRCFIYQSFLFVFCSVLILTPGSHSSFIIEFLGVFVLAICSIALFVKSLPSYSLYKMVHLFFLLFLCIAPVMQFKAGSAIYGIILKEYEYYDTFLLVILALLVYNLTYWSRRKKMKYRPIIEKHQFKNGLFTDICMIIISLCVFSFVFYINGFDIFSMFVRGGIASEKLEMSTSQALMVDNFFRPMNLFVFLLSVYTNRHLITKISLFVLLILTAFPLGMPRFAVAAVYLPVALVCVPQIRKGHTFIISLILAVLVIFPFLSGFRDNYTERDVSFGMSIDFSQFEGVDFDAFSQLSRVVEHNIVTYGQQLLGVVFSWIPRSIWIEKPIGSGNYIAEVLKMDANNIAMCYLGEGYINFGLFGLILYMCILGFATRRLDLWYRNSMKDSLNIYHIAYYVIVGFATFFLRGDMMGAFSYCLGYMTAFFLMKKIILDTLFKVQKRRL